MTDTRPIYPADCTRLAIIAGYAVYEDPTYGDESPVLIAIDGALVASCFWEAPESGELLDFVADHRRGVAR